MDLNVSYALGCDVNCQVTDGFKAAYDIAKRAKAVIAVMGLDQGIERYSISPSLSLISSSSTIRETHDRDDIYLPGLQDKFILGMRDILTSVNSKAPLIVVVMSGSSVDLTIAKVYNDIYIINNVNIIVFIRNMLMQYCG